MQVANISQFRKNIKSYLENVSDNHDPLIINSNGKTVVILSLEEYNKLNDTNYLTSTESNKEMMYKAKSEIEKGQIVVKSFEQIEKMIGND